MSESKKQKSCFFSLYLGILIDDIRFKFMKTK